MEKRKKMAKFQPVFCIAALATVTLVGLVGSFSLDKIPLFSLWLLIKKKRNSLALEWTYERFCLIYRFARSLATKSSSSLPSWTSLSWAAYCLTTNGSYCSLFRWMPAYRAVETNFCPFSLSMSFYAKAFWVIYHILKKMFCYLVILFRQINPQTSRLKVITEYIST